MDTKYRNGLLKQIKARQTLPQRRSNYQYLTIISLARMGSESMAHEAEGRMGYKRD